MDAPYFNGEPGALFSDREWDSRIRPETPLPRCTTCGESIIVGATSVAGEGVWCPGCWRQRTAQRRKVEASA